MKALLLSLLLAMLAGVCLTQARAEDVPKPVPEYAMKAAYLYNFAQLTDWPQGGAMPAKDFTLCVVGEDDVADALEPLRGRMIDGRPLNPIRLSDPADARQCRLLYVGEGGRALGSRLLDSLRGTPVLTVTDLPLVARPGTMLVIVADGKRLAFEVNLDAARRSRIAFSSKLLRLASRVVGE